ncbi:MAG: hypothetical protein HYX93_02720 [Chloroflexi bacterium]|nr:hypothetical protein [Chloroflexota bacterium]
MTRTVAEGLVVAILALPKVAKEEIVDRLLEDREAREIVVHRLMGNLVGPAWSQRGKHASEPGDSPQSGLTSKEIAKQSRDSYIMQLAERGTRVDRIDSVWGKTPDGTWVAFPFATERRPNHWFLGLAEEEALERSRSGQMAVALLCQSASGTRLLDFVLPPRMVQDVVGRFSRSRGQIKFSLKKVGNQYYLVLPGNGSLDVSSYMGKWPSLDLQAAPS